MQGIKGEVVGCSDSNVGKRGEYVDVSDGFNEWAAQYTGNTAGYYSIPVG